MEADFWYRKWKTNDIGFHNQHANPLLVKHLTRLSLSPGSRLFLPLCGKTLDIHWLLENGYKVAGVELSQLAIEQLFDELEMKPQVSSCGELRRYSADNLDIFVGDIFTLSEFDLEKVNAIYDRAALVALPHTMRIQYTQHILKITRNAPQLLISFEYDQNQLEGPPFSVSSDEIKQHYRNYYDLNLLSSESVKGGLKGKCEAKENVWLLSTKEFQ